MKGKLISLMGLVLFAACEGPLRAEYQARTPPLPAAWEEVLGSPRWRVEWLNNDGVWEARETAGTVAVAPADDWTSPVLAWPYWPERGLAPGVMRPAGALFPWDADGDRVNLSWEAGVDAFLWRELAGADENGSGTPRYPWYFDWMRFRALMRDGDISEEVKADPWLADWKTIGAKTLASGFDRRRIVKAKGQEIAVPGLDERWIGASPFAAPLWAEPGEPLRLVTGEAPGTWVSSRGILRCTNRAWAFIPYK